MPPIVGAAAVTAGGALAGGVLSSRANSKAMKTQDQASRRAEAIALENERRRREEYDRGEAMAKAQWDAEQARLAPRRKLQDGLLGSAAARWGMNIGDLGGARQAAAYPGPGAATPTMSDLGGRVQSGYVPPGLDVQSAPRLSIADIANWGSQRRMS